MAVYGGFTGATQYAARQAYYRATYGLPYNEYRKLAVKAKEAGFSGDQTRKALREFKAAGEPPKQTLETLLEQRSQAKTTYSAGQPVTGFERDRWQEFDLDEEWLWYH